MSKITEKIMPVPKPDISEPMRVLCAGKPFLYLNNLAEIIDCDEAAAEVLGISKKDILASQLSKHTYNKHFIESVQKAGNTGISIFRGNVLLGVFSSDVYLEAVLFGIESDEHAGKGTLCCILGCKPVCQPDRVKHAEESKVPEIRAFQYASVSLHALDGSALYISPSIEALLGYTSAELKEMGPMDTVYPEDIPVVKKAVDKLKNGIDFLNSRYRMVRKNGSVVHVESSSYLISDETGTGKHIVNVTWDLSAQAKIEKALQRSEQKYYRLVMNLPTGISLISSDGKLIEVNDSMKKIMGIPLDSPMAEINFFSLDSMKEVNISAQLSKCLDKKEIVNGEYAYSAPGKKQGKFFSYTFVPVLNHNNEIDLVIGYVSDLTLQKKAESEIQERADFLNLVINAIKSPFFVKDEDHKWVMLNDAAVEMMGQPREALLGKSDYELYPKEQADVFWKYDEIVFNEGSSSNEEYINWHDGKQHTVVTHKQLYVEKSSGRKFIVGTIHDISSYKRIEEELRASEMNYRELFDNANDFILTMDLDGNITNANRTLLNFLKTDLETFTKHTVYDFISDDNLASVIAFKDKLLAGSLEGSFEVNALDHDKQPVTYEIKASLIWQNGVLVGVQCKFSDVTGPRIARLKLEEYNRSLLELNKTKDKFFSIIAHDLRNPYSSLIGFTDLLLEDLETLSAKEVRDYLKIIRNSAKNSLNLLENLLAWSRLETGRMPFDPAKIVLTNAIEDVVNVLYSLAYRKKIEINNLVGNDVLLFADKNMLNTILNNLVMNAIKYTPMGGEINVFAGEPFTEAGSGREFIKITVADNGIGMEEEVCKSLFITNKQTSSPGTEKEQGTGLGLLLSREMVEKHGGRIMAESTPGKGSVFSFLIPAFRP